MKPFDIGPGVPCALDVLLNTRLLVQANSGAGKSWLLRRLLEQSHGQVQQLVIDPEGEFATLRERFDYVLAAKTGGDTLADPRAAKLLAERLLELGVSAVLDIYELKAHERVRFVRLFLEALVDAPKALWHPVLVVLDEAHVYAPEKGSAESLQAVIDLATRGRKRGYCLVQATQRLSKLHKDAAAEMNNKLIGRSALDVDMERAGDELGLTKAGRQVLRDLEAGEFFAFGPALTRTVTRVKVGAVQTRHPKAGSKLAGVVPPPTDKVRAVLSKLADLPAEAEQRERSLADLQRDVAAKDRRIKELERVATPPVPAGKAEANEELRAKNAALRVDLTRHRRALEEAVKIVVKIQAVDFAVDSVAQRQALEQAVAAAVRQVTAPIEKRVTGLVDRVDGIRQQAGAAEKAIRALLDEHIDLTVAVSRREPFAVTPASPRPPTRLNARREGAQAASSDGDLPPVQQRILNALAELEQLGAKQPARELVAFMANYTHLQSKGFVNAMSALSTAGCVSYGAGTVALTDAGRARATASAAPQSAREVQDRVIAMLGGASGRILEPLIAAYPKPLPRADVAAAAGYGHLQSKGFVNAISRLRTLGFVDYPDRGSLVAKPVLFLEA